jgi:2-methylaconitate cis-trans-isomerase PrpF
VGATEKLGLFPSGNATDTLTVNGQDVKVTIYHVTNMTVFVKDSDIAFDGTETKAEFRYNTSDSTTGGCQGKYLPVA